MYSILKMKNQIKNSQIIFYKDAFFNYLTFFIF